MGTPSGRRHALPVCTSRPVGLPWSDRVTAGYSGLGYLQTPYLSQSSTSNFGNPARYAVGDTITYDALGNLLSQVTRDTLFLNGTQIPQPRVITNTYNPANGRLMTRSANGSAGTTTYTYDLAGNITFEAQTNPTQGNQRERAAFYAPDGTLRATDSRTNGKRTTEEYRYDGLGRRVWLRQRLVCQPNDHVSCFTPYVRRTIWDGAQELAEIQAPYDTANAALEEMDSGWPLLSYQPLGASDPNPFYGRVLYGPGLAVDQPLSVTRYDYRDYPNGNNSLTWPTFSLVPYWNYQGIPAFGTFSDGASYKPYATGGTSCPAAGNTTTQRCVWVQWPFMHSAYDQNAGNIPYLSWHGSLLEGKRDRSGLEYRRNRLYDPTTGRFTQEDPIGLAGGMNAYGFADSDPVNFGDPFGLCTPPESAECRFIALVAGRTRGLLDLEPAMLVVVSLPTVGFGTGGLGVLNLGRSAQTGTTLARSLGAAGEAAAGIGRNTERIASATKTAAYRVPDGLTATTLTEVKNVGSLSLTNQLRDFAAFARETGRTFELVVRQTTELSRPLQQFIRDNGIQLRFLP